MKQHTRLWLRALLSVGLLCALTMYGCISNDDSDNDSNSAPVPTTPRLVIAKGTTGASQVRVNDPDVGQTHTFAITTAPANGTATVDTTGLVTVTVQLVKT